VPTTTNPFLDDPAKAEVFEEGLIAGFNDPDGSDFRPFAPELLEAFQQGFQDGRADKNEGPFDRAFRWAEKTEVGELAEHAFMFFVFHVADHLFKDFTGAKTTGIPVIDLFLLAATGIAGDTKLQELSPDFRAGFNRDEDDPDIHYIAMCPRSDHDRVVSGVTNDGYFLGPDRRNIAAAIDDMNAHGHPEAFVTRCSLKDNTCGSVWVGVPTNFK
jgi:hypothetical protein